MRGVALLRDLVGGARARWRRREFAVSFAAAASGFVAVWISCGAWQGRGAPLAAVAAAAGAATVAWAAGRAGAILRAGPTDTAVAAWIEGALPALRDSLVTALETQALAENCAAFATNVLAGAPDTPRAAVSRVGRAARARLMAAALGSVVLALGAYLVPRSAPVPPHVEAPARPPTVEVISVRPDVRAVPTPGPLFEVVAPEAQVVPASVRPLRGPDPVDILLAAPQGFERAVELFVAGARPAEERRSP